MQEPEPARTDWQSAASWLAFVLALLCLANMALRIPLERSLFRTMLAEYKIPLPRVTQLAYSIPDPVFPAIAGAVGILAFVLQLKTRKQGGAVWLHVLITILCFVLLELFRNFMFLAPVFTMPEGMKQ